jgi:hypothetical protein
MGRAKVSDIILASVALSLNLVSEDASGGISMVSSMYMTLNAKKIQKIFLFFTGAAFHRCNKTTIVPPEAL